MHYLTKREEKFKKSGGARKIVDVMIVLARRDTGFNSKILSFKNALHMAATCDATALETTTRYKTRLLTELMKLLTKLHLQK